MQGGRRKIGVLGTVKEAYGVATASFVPAVSVAGVPFLGGLVIPVAAGLMGNVAAAVAGSGLFVAVMVCSFCAIALAAQAKALDLEIPLAPGVLFARGQFWKYVGSHVAYTLVSAVVGLPCLLSAFLLAGGMTGFQSPPSPGIAALALLAVLAGAGASFYVSIRLSLITPAVAAGHPFSVSASWRLTSGNFLPIAGALLLGVIPVGIVQSVIESAGKQMESTAATVTVAILVLAVTAFQALIAGAVGGICYRSLSAE